MSCFDDEMFDVLRGGDFAAATKFRADGLLILIADVVDVDVRDVDGETDNGDGVDDADDDDDGTRVVDRRELIDGDDDDVLGEPVESLSDIDNNDIVDACEVAFTLLQVLFCSLLFVKKTF